MRMNNGKTIACVLVVSLAAGLLGVYLYASRESLDLTAQGGQTHSFVKPAFAESLAIEPTFLDEEAGISLYLDTGGPLDLSIAKAMFRTIEKETSDYVVGSVPLPDLTENDDVHCFVHEGGWIVVYYLKDEPLIKIANWNYWSEDLTKDKLQTGLELICNGLGEYISGAKYYHFQYPDANKFMVILETLEGPGQDGFNMTILPVGLDVNERSWCHYALETNPYVSSSSEFQLDGNTINLIQTTGSGTFEITEYGKLNPTELPPNLLHVVTVTSTQVGEYGVGIALVYHEPYGV